MVVVIVQPWGAPLPDCWCTHLGVTANLLLALLAGVGEFGLVAGQTMGLLVAEDIALTSQRNVTTAASKMSCVVFLIHGTCIFLGKYELKRRDKKRGQKLKRGSVDSLNTTSSKLTRI